MGWKGADFQLQIAADGRSQFYNPEMTMLQFFEVYAPSTDNNSPEIYCNFVCEKLKVAPTMKIKELL